MYLHQKFQKAYHSNKRYIVFYSGRAAGKTTSVGKVMLTKALEKNCKILCTRKYQVSIRDSVYSTLVELIEKYDCFKGRFETLKTSIRCKDTGSEIIFRGCQNMPEIKSLQGIQYVWIEEANYIDEEDFETLSKTIRKKDSQIWVIFNPHLEEDYVYQRFVVNSDPLALVEKISWRDNPFFQEDYIGSLVLEREIDQERDLNKYNWIWEGECLKEVEGALFRSEWFKYEQVDPKRLEKIGVAVDPSITAGDKSDECGICVVGSYGNKFVVLDDQSRVASPKEWASLAIGLYHKYEANSIIAEVNQGGDMVKTIIKQIDRDVPVVAVRASKGKLLRAEPAASLYEEGRVIHTRRFPELEYQMTTYNGDPKQKSPDRLDALVWGLTWLMKKQPTEKHSLVGVKF